MVCVEIINRTEHSRTTLSSIWPSSFGKNAEQIGRCRWRCCKARLRLKLKNLESTVPKVFVTTWIIRRSKERRKDGSHTSPVSDLSEAMKALRDAVNGKGKASLGKRGAEILSALREVERRQSIIVEAVKVQDAEKLFDFGPCVDALEKDIELESRIRGQLQKDIQLLVMAREFQRQYGAKHAPRETHRPRSARTLRRSSIKRSSEMCPRRKSRTTPSGMETTTTTIMTTM